MKYRVKSSEMYLKIGVFVLVYLCIQSDVVAFESASKTIKAENIVLVEEEAEEETPKSYSERREERRQRREAERKIRYPRVGREDPLADQPIRRGQEHLEEQE
jgi:hypothetical protein